MEKGRKSKKKEFSIFLMLRQHLKGMVIDVLIEIEGIKDIKHVGDAKHTEYCHGHSNFQDDVL